MRRMVHTVNARDNITPVEIKSVQDIRKVVAPFIRSIPNNKVDIEGKVDWTDDDGTKNSTNVKSHSTDTNARKGLIDGFNHVKEQEEMWNRLYNALNDDEYSATIPKLDIDNMVLPVDRIIRQRLGGIREGYTVVWHLPTKKVVFYPYDKKLEEIPLEQ